MHVTVCKSEERLLGFLLYLLVSVGEQAIPACLLYAGFRYIGLYCHV